MNSGDIKSFSEISLESKENILIGNGFSVAICRKFSYKSLKEYGENNGILDAEAMNVFSNFDTINFELILGLLSSAIRVDNLYGLHCDPIARSHANVRDALIECVNSIHPAWESVSQEYLYEANRFFKEFDNVFSLNYDLFMYWIMAHNFSRFTDFFWSGSNLEFSSFDTDVWDQKAKIYYLHGALFLIEENGIVCKVRNTGNNIISSIGRSISSGKLPLYVSEGSSEEKFKAIRSTPYLAFAYEKLLKAQKGITIIGASLDDTDKHISSAITKNRSFSSVAFGIYTHGKSTSQLDEEVFRVQHIFSEISSSPKRNLEVFDSSSCPAIYDSGRFGIIE